MVLAKSEFKQLRSASTLDKKTLTRLSRSDPIRRKLLLLLGPPTPTPVPNSSMPASLSMKEWSASTLAEVRIASSNTMRSWGESRRWVHV